MSQDTGGRSETPDLEASERIARCFRGARDHLRWAGHLLEEGEALLQRELRMKDTPPREAECRNGGSA